MFGWITQLIEAGGYGGVVLLMFLENVFPPIPSELIMPLAGFVATRGELSFVGVILAGMVGSLIGQLPLYWLGAAVGAARLKRWADDHGAWLALSGADINKSLRWFERFGGVAVFLCRLVPGVRSLISIPAGVYRMNLVRFLLYSAAGTGLWAAVLAYLGRILGENYDRVEQYVGPVSYVVLGLLIASFVFFVVRRKWGQGQQDAAEP